MPPPPATPNVNFTPGEQYGYDPNLATDATNRTVMAWYSSAAGHLGVIARDVNPDGSPGPGPLTMPGTSGMNTGMLSRTPLVARRGGGFYVAYQTPSGVRVWREERQGGREVRQDQRQGPRHAHAAPQGHGEGEQGRLRGRAQAGAPLS